MLGTHIRVQGKEVLGRKVLIFHVAQFQ